MTAIEKTGGSLIDVVRWSPTLSLGDELRRQTRPAVLLRGFPVTDDASFRTLATSLNPAVSRYLAGQTDRAQTSELVYEATRLPSFVPIHLHAEMSYSRVFPSHLFFFALERCCLGGASWLASNARIWAGLPASLQDRLARHGVRYVRLLPPDGHRALRYFRAARSGALKSWQESLEVDSREAAEASLRRRGLEFTWTDDGWLDLSSVLPAHRDDPVTGERLWFNQCHTMQVNPFLHGRLVTALFRGVSRMIGRVAFGASLGDGTAFTDDDWRAIRQAHDQARIEATLAQGDVLYFDNLRLSHGRGPYVGVRRVRVIFAGLPQE